ncbi:hypothetical protein NLU13_0328 [Sarocladium strictum]|uniref:Uncharacterized protein n=1 Tax=Sarocladium strictum TaxID=5046 RepID=A0AA39GNV0_SARSR|nr:hypothetical protein NLU13_0328 [Sarocladium strictum]
MPLLRPTSSRGRAGKADVLYQQVNQSPGPISGCSLPVVSQVAGEPPVPEQVRVAQDKPDGERWPGQCDLLLEQFQSRHYEAAVSCCSSNVHRSSPNENRPFKSQIDSRVHNELDDILIDEPATGILQPAYTRASLPPPSARPIYSWKRLIHPNGALVFSNISTAAEEAMSANALSQAQGEAIAEIPFVMDDVSSIETAISLDVVDSDYESDGHTSETTSTSSSVHDFLYENGRRFHRFREGRYAFPNDEPEQEREDLKHAMTKILCHQNLHFAPLGSNTQQVLDMGTGTGTWAVEMGDQYPNAEILGVDLSPIQPAWLPPNVRFVVDDVESHWLYPPDYFDYIHSRHVVMAIRDWPRLMRQSIMHLKPGGWVELQEIHHFPMGQHDRPISLNDPIAQYWSSIREGLSTLGVDSDIIASGELPAMMREAGFVNVKEQVIKIPLGTWPEGQVLKTVGLYWRTILLDGLQAIGMGPLTRGLRWSPEAVELFLVQVRRAYLEDTTGMYMPFHIICGQKPA